MSNVTEWFPGNVKPVRPGFYEVRNDPATAPSTRSQMYLTGRRRYFNGETWRGGWLGEIVSIFGRHPSHQWRGLTKASHDMMKAKK
jgi:hypothetical protein